VLKGHERSLTHVAYNRDGDLLFSCSKDNKPTVWYSDNGERLGTYEGHKGTIWHLDVNEDSTLLATASADSSARIWDVETGKELFCFPHMNAVRCVGFSEGDGMLLSVGDKSMGQEATVFIFKLNRDDWKSRTLFKIVLY
jgi:translation initiation factor 3 subunit I